MMDYKYRDSKESCRFKPAKYGKRLYNFGGRIRSVSFLSLFFMKLAGDA